jgi:hypothetical protein
MAAESAGTEVSCCLKRSTLRRLVVKSHLSSFQCQCCFNCHYITEHFAGCQGHLRRGVKSALTVSTI